MGTHGYFPISCHSWNIVQKGIDKMTANMYMMRYYISPQGRSWCPLAGTWDWPSKIAGNWECFLKISWDFGIAQNPRIFDWDCTKLNNWELGFGLTISWELGLGTPHHDPPQGFINYLEQ